MAEGKIVPVEITCELIKEAMERHGWNKKKFLIDGFPRNMNNYEGWMKVMGDQVIVPFIVVCDADEDTMIERILERAKTSGRIDDNIESLKKRFAVFKNETLPIVNLF